MVEDQLHFDRRVRRLSKKHEAMSRGYTTRMRKDGLIVMSPRRARPGVSLKAIVLFVGALLLFKGFLMANLGPESYADRVGRLSEGTAVEKAGAWVMQPDPVTLIIAEKMGPILR